MPQDKANSGDSRTASLAGKSAELVTAALAMAEGYAVLIPMTQYTRYDLVIDVGGRLLRVQVKKASYIPARQRTQGWGDREAYRADLTNGATRVSGKRYQGGEFDILAAVCAFDTVYVMPVSALASDRPGAQPGELVRHVLIKPDDGQLTRQDALAAAARWLPYRNSFAEALRVLGCRT